MKKMKVGSVLRRKRKTKSRLEKKRKIFILTGFFFKAEEAKWRLHV